MHVNQAGREKLADRIAAIINATTGTANATEEVKKIATGVIGSCEEEGVAEFLKERFQN